MEKLTDREVREKLVSRGVQSLSDRELLSIILGEGSAGYSAVETAYAHGAITSQTSDFRPADSIARDGHIANKIGTFQIAILAKYGVVIE